MAGCETESLGRTLSALRDAMGSGKDAYTDYIVGRRVNGNGLSEENTCEGILEVDPSRCPLHLVVLCV